MAKSLELGDFVDLFLDKQGLSGFSMNFEPARKGKRRAKRRSVIIECNTQALEERELSGRRTVADLVQRFYSLAPETAAWTEEAVKPYKLKIRDLQGSLVDDADLLGELRGRQEALRNAAIERGRKSLGATIRELERALERKDVDKLLKEALIRKD